MSSLIKLAGLLLTLALAFPSAAKTVAIGAEDDWPPFSSKGPNPAEPAGVAPKLVREAFAAVGVQVQFSTLPFARCMQYAETGQLAGCFNATRLPTNQDTFCWHPTPMFHEELAIYAAAPPGPKDLGPQDLAGKRLGLTIGYTYPKEVIDNPRIKRHEVRSDDQLLRMLAAGRVDFALMNATPAAGRLAANPQLFSKIRRVGAISVDGFWIAFSKKHPDGAEMCKTFETGLLKIQQSGRHRELLHNATKQSIR